MIYFKHYLIWILTNGFMAALAWAGLQGGHLWAWNMFRFALSSFLICYVLGMAHPSPEKLKRKVYTNSALSIYYDFALALFLAAYGQFFWAAACLIQGVFCVGINQKVKEACASASDDPQATDQAEHQTAS